MKAPTVRPRCPAPACSRIGRGIFLLVTLLALWPAWTTQVRSSSRNDAPLDLQSEQAYYSGACSVVDLPLAEILADFPELEGLKPASDQAQLNTLLDKAGEDVAEAYRHLTSVAADERITAEKFGDSGRVTSRRHYRFYYIILAQMGGPSDRMEEYRADTRMNPVGSPGLTDGFPFSHDFASQWMLLYPENQSGSRFRYLGKQLSDGREANVLAFAAIPGQAAVTGLIKYQGTPRLLLYQGLVWIDVQSNRIVKLRLDLLQPRLDAGLEKETTEIKFAETRVPDGPVAPWLPRAVTVTAIWNGQIFRNVHQYLGYRIFGARSSLKF